MKIQVTEEDIRTGKRNNMTACPIALAFEKIFSDELLGVGPHALYTREGTYNLPQRARNFVRAFDTGEVVKPFSFTIKL